MDSSILAKLSSLEDEYGNHVAKSKEQELQEWNTYVQKCLPLYERRRKLVNGSEDPSEAELKGCPVSLIDQDLQTRDLVPGFWATVLKNEDRVGEFISHRDGDALKYVEDIKLVSNTAVNGVVFCFRENPYFSNTELRRVVGWVETSQGVLPVEEGSKIVWKPNQNFFLEDTTINSTKDQEQGKKRSFFTFFEPVAALASSRQANSCCRVHCNPHEEVDETALKVERDELIIKCIRDRVIPKALHIYNSGSLQASHSDDHKKLNGDPATVHIDPSHVQSRIYALKKGQKQLDNFHEDYVAAISEIRKARLRQLQTMGSQRQVLLNPAGGDGLKIPNFWVKAIRALALGSVAVHKRDEKALSFLRNIQYDWMINGDNGESVKETYEFEFFPNPYFENPVLTRKFVFTGSILDDLNGKPELDQATSINWKPGMHLTCKPSPVKNKSASMKPAASFFCLFNPGGAQLTFNVLGDGNDAKCEARELELEFFQQIKDELVVQPAALIAEIGSDSSIDHNNVNEAGSGRSCAAEEEHGQHAREANIEAHQKWSYFRPTNQNILIGALVLMIIAEVAFFWDNLSNVTKGKFI